MSALPRTCHGRPRAFVPRCSAGQASEPRSAAAVKPPGVGAQPGDRIALTTMKADRPTLGVSVWPDFDYDAAGATTLGVVGDPDPDRVDADGNPLVHLCFDVKTFEGPPVWGKTTKVFGVVPLPPGIRIDIVPLKLEGWLDVTTGACDLDFDAEFRGSIFGEDVIKLPPMSIRSPMTTGETKGAFKAARGKRFTKVTEVARAGPGGATHPCGGGRPGDLAELVAIARVPKVSGPWDWLMNALLLLPTDALAVLPCRLRVWAPGEEGHDRRGTGEEKDEAAIVAALDARFDREVTRRAAP